MGHAGPDRRDSLVPAHAIGVAWAARLGCRADAAVGDGMIVAASTALLADSRSGGRGIVVAGITEHWTSTGEGFGHRSRWRWPPRTRRGRSTTPGPRTARRDR